MNDPFASAPAEEAQTEVPPAESVGSVTVDVVPVIRPVETGTEIVTTFKAGQSFEQPWVVIHASSIAQSDAMLDQEFADYLAKVKKVASFFNGTSGAPAAAGGTSRPLQQGQPAGSVEPPAWAPPKPFDDFVYVTKIKKETGKSWHAWMPPEKDDARKPVFFYPPR